MSSPPCSRAQRAPAALAAMAPRPAHFAPRSTGVTGRLPDGPRRRSSVAVAPIAAPMRAAVSRSYWASRPVSPSRADSRTRGSRFGLVGIAVPIVVLLRRRIRSAERFGLRILGVKRGGSGAHTAHRRRRRDEHRLGFLLHHLQQRVELAQPLLRQRHRLLQSLVRRGDRRVHLLYV